jgi:hypothetical protein
MAKMRPRKLPLLVFSSTLFGDQPVIRRYEAVILTAYVKYTTINPILLGDGIQRRITMKSFEHLF